MTGGIVLGERKTELGPPVAGGSVVHLNATAVLGTVQVDDRAVVDVGVVFGSVRVVVPDDARVRTAGTVVFGSVDCDDRCPTGTGDEVLVRGTGAFASIEIVTQSQVADD